MAKKSTAIDVTQGVIWQQLLSLCVPIFFSSFFQQAYTLIGTYIVGQFGGKLALGGIQATMVLTELLHWLLRWRRRRLRGHYRSVFWPAR